MIGSSLRALLVSGWLGALLCVGVGPAAAQDASELIVRLNRLEGQMRQLAGQVEQLGHENRQLKEQLRKFAEDVEFRFQDQQKGSRAAPPPPAAAKPERPGRRSDAFDPGDAPAAPGAPKPLGATPPGRDGIASIIENDRPSARAGDLGPDARGVAGLNPDFGKRGAPAGAAASGAKGAFDAAYASFSQRQYPQAEAGFRDFIRDNPRDRLVGDATYWLGETYLRQNKPKEAAQQFLKVTQEHGKSGKAADAMLKLGVSLTSLGAKDQACATFAELGRKYPSAAAHVKQGAEREQKKAGCAA
jgi:tol-pal system protein YbgF